MTPALCKALLYCIRHPPSSEQKLVGATDFKIGSSKYSFDSSFIVSTDSSFNISLIVRVKVTSQCPQTTTFEVRGELKYNPTDVPQPYQPSLTARPNDSFSQYPAAYGAVPNAFNVSHHRFSRSLQFCFA